MSTETTPPEKCDFQGCNLEAAWEILLARGVDSEMQVVSVTCERHSQDRIAEIGPGLDLGGNDAIAIRSLSAPMRASAARRGGRRRPRARNTCKRSPLESLLGSGDSVRSAGANPPVCSQARYIRLFHD
jgi:hypothetical protein